MQALCTKSESFTRLLSNLPKVPCTFFADRCQFLFKKLLTTCLDEAECYRQLRQLQWPDGKVHCPYCGSDHIRKRWTYFRESTCHRYRCDTCGKSFNEITPFLRNGYPS